MKQYFELLPPRLKNFFKKYPPGVQYSAKPEFTTSPTANPFLPNKNPVTGRYQEPKYSLRRMSDLYKLAYNYGLQDMLPPSKKLFFEEKYEQKKLTKAVVFPKGEKHERMRAQRVAEMEEAIKNADQFILEARGAKYARRLERKKEKERTWF
ncbi:AaceriAER207Cp [[Ashbya] aceris (nom. inval.)]|nr:AaceriAER207Cp [[Ashbya] aceris (nom. inval.)]